MTSWRILIVDDDESVRALLRMTLPEKWYDVSEACDGEEALELLDGVVPDLVLLDWAMPKRSGSDVLRALKTRHPAIPVIVLTAQLAATHRAEAEELGADAFLTKPFSPLELLGAIERLLPERPPDEAA